MDSSYFTAQAIYQFGARALGMGDSSAQRRDITSGSCEAARAEATNPSAMDVEPAGSLIVSLDIHLKAL